MDESAVDAGPDNVTSRTHYPLTELGILTRVLRTITEYAHLSFEMTGIVLAIFSFRQPLRFAQALPSLEVFRILFLFCMLHFFLREWRRPCIATIPVIYHAALRLFTKACHPYL